MTFCLSNSALCSKTIIWTSYLIAINSISRNIKLSSIMREKLIGKMSRFCLNLRRSFKLIEYNKWRIKENWGILNQKTQKAFSTKLKNKSVKIQVLKFRNFKFKTNKSSTVLTTIIKVGLTFKTEKKAQSLPT